MATVFLSHASIDKPFVEKLAKDLEGLGIHVWYDKYEIKVGDSILWKVMDGIQASEYLAIVISEQAMQSTWVQTEIASAWQKQVKMEQKVLLPIYYRECTMPPFLTDLKYADFRTDYQAGLQDLAQVFGIRELETITQDNWRRFVRREGNWKEFRDREFAELVTEICRIARTFRISIWTGGTQNPYSL